MLPLQLGPEISTAEARNDFYVTIRGGEFLQDKKKSAKNVQVRLQVLTGAVYIMRSPVVCMKFYMHVK